MNYLKIDRQVVCKMAMLLAFMFAACSEDGKSIADGGTAEETGIYALKNSTVAGKVGDLVPMTFVAMKDNGDTLQKSNLVLDSLDEAIGHINRYHTGHSDAIVTNDRANAERFLNEVDSACVYTNASTRFTDGFMFGFGAEIGISTQKIHARGPMGLEALTSYKYMIRGYGQVRE